MATDQDREIVEYTPKIARGRDPLMFCFWVWGIAGFVVGALQVLGAITSVSGIGVGQSSYVTMGLTFWIGGMVLFGLGAALAESSYQPLYNRTLNHDWPNNRNGFPYRVNADGSVTALTSKGEKRYPTWKDFWTATDIAPK